MRIYFNRLTLFFHRSTVEIDFPKFSYFYGPIGAGKSSIGRLIDYCLGSSMEWTPALQQEFVSASLNLRLNDSLVSIQRDRDANSVVATWRSETETLQVSIPTKTANGEVLPDARVEVLSDLLFYLANEDPPRVRRRKGRPDERLERLSFRDLFRFCYLDQQGMDSDFFRLNSDNYAVKQKSVDALRYVLGYQTERVAELESQMQITRETRIGLQLSSQALAKALAGAGIDSAEVLEDSIREVTSGIEVAKAASVAARDQRTPIPRIDEELRERARGLTYELVASSQAKDDLETRIDDLARHANELEMLSVRFQRTSAARTVLGGVDFKDCPRCTQLLPNRDPTLCRVCGQPDHVTDADGMLDQNVIDQDLRTRRAELADALQRLRSQKGSVTARITQLAREKVGADSALSERLQSYDSEFLSQALMHERTIATLKQKLSDLEQNRRLPALLQEQREQAEEKRLEEAKIQSDLEAARGAAFRDRRNLDVLGSLFLDCLIRSKFPDVRPTDRVEIDATTFYPRIPLGGDDAMVVLTYDNAGSGGMMALFRTCFAVALHRLSTSLSGGRLPSTLVIDTATKNVSSVENPEVVNSFYRMIYELSLTELASTQFLVIDNEFTPPPEGLEITLQKRHMMRGDPENPPLVPYLSGDFFE